ncbi:MAG: Phthiocerol synthesis polyketide synthase type I PpsC [Chlamydiae bacterium]|nr:Phthiocerol synthesis polyketide synthase type I PpsC [Chlamydiota bacterium]
MKKVVIRKPGSYEKLEFEEFSSPPLKKDEVLIECRACGVNFADCCVRMGVYLPAKVYVGWPITPGFEVSGVVKEVGEEVSKFSVGQRVVAISLFGGYSSHVAVKERQVFPLPEKMSFNEGAAFPTVFLTAYYALFELAHPRAGNVILIHSAAGGVGSSLVQLGKLAHCRVVGVVGSSHKIDTVKTLGADVVIDKSKQDLWKEAEAFSPEGYDIILDANGAETLWQSYKHLSSGGKLVVYGFHSMLSKGRGRPNWFKVLWDYLRTPRFNPLNLTTDNRSVLGFNLAYLFDKGDVLREGAEQLLKWLEEEKITLPPIQTFPLEKVAEAHKALESGETVGKLVLIP